MRTIALLAFSPVLFAESLTGVWSGTVTVNQLDIPFRFEIQAKGSQVNGTFFNGEQRFTSTSGQLNNDSLTLGWDYLAAKLDAKLVNGELDGTYSRGRSRPLHFHAVRFTPPAAVTEKVPEIGGVWIIEGVKSSKAESAWHLIVKQKGADADAAILRIDGDTGTLHGSYKDGKFVLSHFSGMRPALLEVTPAPGGKLNLVLDGRE